SALSADTMMFLHQNTGLSVLNLPKRSVSPIVGPNVANGIPDLDVEKLWLAPPGDRLGFLDLRNYHPNEVRLDADIEHFIQVPPGKAARKVVATHPSLVGYLTVLSAEKPSDLGEAYAVSGYLFEGVLGGGGQ